MAKKSPNSVTIPVPGDSADIREPWSVPGADPRRDRYQRASGAFRQSLKDVAKKLPSRESMIRKGGRD